MSAQPNSNYEYHIGGSVPVNSPTYVTRQADSDLYEGLKAGEFCYVLNSRQMGKSSLRVRTMQRLQAEGIACAAIDMTAIGTSDITPEQWYAGVIYSLISSLELYETFDLGTWWTERGLLSYVQRFSRFIEEVLLPSIPQQIVIFVDEIDSILSLKFNIDDFFAVIRDCYNKRADNPDYRRLTFALIGVATPSDLIADKRRTPFNIGRAIELTGFQLGEARALAPGLAQKADNPLDVIRELLAWTGGQPFLTQKLCKLVLTSPFPITAGSEAELIEQLVRSRIISNWEAQDEPEHLKTIRDRILVNEKRASRLLGLYQQVLQQGGVAANDTPEQMELRLTGLVVRQQAQLRVANRIYQEVFNSNWVEKELANLRPYSEAFNAWLTSNCQDESRLLRGQALQDATAWAAGKSLSDRDYQFLAASQELDKREVQCILEAEKEASRILAQANQALEAVLKSASSKALFIAGQEFEALLEALRAGKQLQAIEESVRPKVDSRMQVVRVLQQAVYGVKERNRLEGHRSVVYSLSFSPDGQMIASASGDGTIKLWSLDGKERQNFQGHSSAVYSVCFSPDSQTIASASLDGSIKLWSLDGKEQQTFQGHRISLLNICFSPDGQTIAFAGDNGIIKLWSLDGKERQTLQGHRDSVHSISFSPDGQTFASASLDDLVKLWSRDGRELQTLQGHRDSVNSVCFSPDGQTIASASDDGTIKIWNLDGKEVRTLQGHSSGVNSIGFSSDGQTLASASCDHTIKLWSLDGTEQQTFQGHNDWVFSVSFSPDGQTVASGSRDGTVKLWATANRELKTLRGHNRAVYSVCFSPDGQMVACASHHTVKLWSIEGRELKTLRGHSRTICSICFSPDGQTIASASSDGYIKLWSPDGIERRTLQGHSSRIDSISFSPNGQTLVSASLDGIIKLWSLDGIERQTLQGRSGTVHRVCFSPDGQMIASASEEYTVKLWGIEGSEQQTLRGHSGSVYSICFSPDGQMIASASGDWLIKLWSIDGREQHTLKGHSSAVYSVSFSPDGQLIASASRDHTIKLWSRDGRELQTLNGHSTVVHSISFSPDGQTLASASADGTVILWNFSLDSLMELGCSWVADYLKNNPNVSESDRCLCDGIFDTTR